MPKSENNELGRYLRDRREKLDPSSLGLSSTRRRTPGLRREEIAHRADISATWYTWLEQGRGGTPSSEVLDRISGALELSPVEREHLFLLAQHRPPEVRYQEPDPVAPQLQRIIDSLQDSPAYVRTSTWDVEAWNAAAAAVIIDFAGIPPAERNLLRMVFCNSDMRDRLVDWESQARFAVAAYRSDIARAGAGDRSEPLVRRLRSDSPEFDAMWSAHDIVSYGPGTKQLRHPPTGLTTTFEYMTFAVQGGPELDLAIYTPATTSDQENVRAIVRARG